MSSGAPQPKRSSPRLYEEFLEARKLSAALTSGHDDQDPLERERLIFENRRTLRNLEAGIAAGRALLADASHDAPADAPSEALYFKIWSGHLGEGAKPVIRRLEGGALEYSGKQFTRDAALPCAVPSRVRDYDHQAFLDCLTGLQPPTGTVTSTAAAPARR